MLNKLISAFFLLLLASFLSAAEEKDKSYSFTSVQKVGDIDRVTVQLKAGGSSIHRPINPKGEDKTKEIREKISVQCDLVYDEKTLAMPKDDEKTLLTLRAYEKADAALQHEEDAWKSTLRSDRNLILAEAKEDRTTLASPQGPLTREELELIDILANSLLVERLLPDKPVKIGEVWKPSDKLLASFFDLDDIGQNDIEISLKEVTDKRALFVINGRLSGVQWGTAAEIEVKANFRFNFRLNRVDWIGLLAKEQRNIGEVHNGMDLVTQFTLTAVPTKNTAAFEGDAVKDLSLKITPESELLEGASPKGNWKIAYDRRWNITQDRGSFADLTELKFIDAGDFLAYCRISSVPKITPEKLPTLEAFQADLKRLLKDQFGEFIEAGEKSNPNRRMFRVVVKGTASDKDALNWIYYHVADTQGNQVVFGFTVFEKWMEKFADADKKLVDSFQFTAEKK